MDDSTALQATVNAALEAIGTLAPDLDLATIERAPTRTIEPSKLPQESAKRALALLREVAPPGNLARQLRMGELLGRGGMGEVHLAEQVSMGRRVAVKTLREEMANETNVTKLLQEAWVTGYLEHPNVLPVYDIAIDDNDRPVILLKRIEGVQWGELMDDAERVRERFAASDLLEWNLRVLMQVCDAVHYAHSLGILHRDLKPENIMIGEFGEVYVVDWGIAVSTREEHAERIPLARHAKQMAGTPCYMAPEMLGGERPAVTERTDVYLLGAMLYELIAGHVPHTGQSLREIVRSVISTPPEVPDGVPHELGRICRRAMDADPNARFENPLQFKYAVEGFLLHRGSRRLARRAAGRLRELLEELERPDADDTDERRHMHLYNLHAECRFAFRESLKEWPDNAAAREGERRATTAMVEYELRAGDAKAAATLISGLDPQPADLRERVDEALQERARAQDRLRRLAVEQADNKKGHRARTVIALVSGLLWTISPVTLHQVLDVWLGFEETHLALVYLPLVVLCISFVLMYWARDAISATLTNQRLAATLAFTMVAQMVLAITCGITGISIPTTATLLFFLWMTAAGLASIMIMPKLWPATIGYAVALFASVYLPEYRYWFMSASHGVLTIVIMFMWGPLALEMRERGEDPPPYPDLSRLKRLSELSGATVLGTAERDDPRDGVDTPPSRRPLSDHPGPR